MNRGFHVHLLICLSIICQEVTCDVVHYGLGGKQCFDECGTKGNSYYWCNLLGKGWDYCSPQNNMDYKGHACRDDSPCEKHGYSYNWCYLKKGGWDYCSIVEPKIAQYRSRYGKLCVGDCGRRDGTSYNWCWAEEGSWEYCSVVPDTTYQGEKCQGRCGLHGESYYWCRTRSSWDYCGKVETRECEFTSCSAGGGRRKRSSPGQDGICAWAVNDTGNGIRTELRFAPSDHILSGFEREVCGISGRWNNGLLRYSPGTLINDNGFRLDLQGLFKRNGQRYRNLQIQRNVPRRQGHSTTYSHIEVPDGVHIPERYIRHAFEMSALKGGKVTIVVIRFK